MSEWPKRFAKMQAHRALAVLPEKARPFYHAEYTIDFGGQDGDFAGLVCDECSHWHEYGHEEGCRVRRLEPDYRWRPKIVRAPTRIASVKSRRVASRIRWI